MLKRYGLMGHVLWVHYSVPLEYCKAWDQRLCPIGCLSHLLMAPLNTPSSFQLHLSSFLLNYFFPFDLCFHGWRVSLGSHSKAPRCSVWKALSPGPCVEVSQLHCGAGGLLPPALLPPTPWAPATRGGQRLTLPYVNTVCGSGKG